MNEDILRRLAVARHLFKNGCDQSNASNSLAALSILMFHDAAEIFLQLACEFKGAVGLSKNPNFEDYWPSLTKADVDIESHRESMRRLNKMRVGLKHSGILPDRDEIQGIRSIVENFFNNACIKIFKIEFESITRSFLIKNSFLREALQVAERDIANNQFKDALEHMMIVFLTSIGRKQNDRLYDPRSRVSSITFFAFAGGRGSDEKTAKALRELSDVFGEAILVIGYKLDFAGYQLLRANAPVIHQIPGGKPIIEWMHQATHNRKIVVRCFDFVLDTCLRLEEIESFVA